MGCVPSTDRRGEVGKTRESNDQPKASGCSETCLGLAAMSRKEVAQLLRTFHRNLSQVSSACYGGNFSNTKGGDIREGSVLRRNALRANRLPLYSPCARRRLWNGISRF